MFIFFIIGQRGAFSSSILSWCQFFLTPRSIILEQYSMRSKSLCLLFACIIITNLIQYWTFPLSVPCDWIISRRQILRLWICKLEIFDSLNELTCVLLVGPPNPIENLSCSLDVLVGPFTLYIINKSLQSRFSFVKPVRAPMSTILIAVKNFCCWPHWSPPL